MFPNKYLLLKAPSSTKYDRALIDKKSIITTTMNNDIKSAMTL